MVDGFYSRPGKFFFFLISFWNRIENLYFLFIQTLLSCVEELNLNEKTILFWNWRPQATGVAWRLGADFGKLFRTTDTLDELIENEIHLKMSSNGVVDQ